MDGTALLLCGADFRSANGKTAHGLIRGGERYRIVGVVDSSCPGSDAGDLLDGAPRGIPVFAGVEEALSKLPEKPDFAVVGIATAGGRIPPSLRADIARSLASGVSVVNGLHELVSADPELLETARARRATITDVRRPRSATDLRFWTGEVLEVEAPRVAVLGTDCAVGKRTTARLLAEACRAGGLAAEVIYTGQTGWLQGGRWGFILDATPNDFVSGELERAILSCAREASPRVIFLEGQSSLRNPAGPCGAELLLSAGARAVVLQHAPARREFEGLEHLHLRIPPLEDEVDLIRRYGAQTIGVALHTGGLGERREKVRAGLEAALGVPVVCPLEEGVARLVPAIEALVAEAGA